MIFTTMLSSITVFIGLLLIWNLVLTFILFKIKHRPSPPSPVPVSPHLHLGLVRFTPFSDTGGDQSFVLSLLDEGGSGILITSLHGRGVTRLYAKKVNGGKTDQPLSAEEKQALQEALDT